MKIKYPKNYNYSRNEIILKYCEWKKVLHIWACDSPYTKEKYQWNWWKLLYIEIDKICLEQYWIDIDKKSIEFLKSKSNEFKNSKIEFFDMNKLENLKFQPDIIIFWEVIEHLMNIEIALTNIKKVMKKDTLLLISTPNCFYFPNFINTLFWFEQMHEDHKIFFSYWYLKNLLKFNKLVEEKFYFTSLEIKSSLNIKWKLVKLLIKIILFLSKWFSETLLFIVKKK